MKKEKGHPRPKGLSDKELIAKYDTGAKVNFEKVIRNFIKTPSPSAIAKGKK